jgi:type IV secretory pathway VirB10-like protein
MAVLSTLAGWSALLGIGAGYYLYHTRARRTPVAAIKQSIRQVESKEPKAKKAPAKAEKATKKKLQQPVPKSEKEDQGTSTAISNDRDDEVDNREFARQLSNIKSGHIPASKSKTEKKQKSVKQSKAQENKVAAESSDNADAPSSATGGDADDDGSSVNSTEMRASDESVPATVRDIFWHNHFITDSITYPARRRL